MVTSFPLHRRLLRRNGARPRCPNTVLPIMCELPSPPAPRDAPSGLAPTRPGQFSLGAAGDRVADPLRDGGPTDDTGGPLTHSADVPSPPPAVGSEPPGPLLAPGTWVTGPPAPVLVPLPASLGDEGEGALSGRQEKWLRDLQTANDANSLFAVVSEVTAASACLSPPPRLPTVTSRPNPRPLPAADLQKLYRSGKGRAFRRICAPTGKLCEIPLASLKAHFTRPSPPTIPRSHGRHSSRSSHQDVEGAASGRSPLRSHRKR
ncbi:uncharacterized protein LOC124158445 [Ischnura elegans]|uniref:uncharacterized protein LOC124158445 n=1 Tax=Ischnura elegans TaxID=197161 RepID=UPI001ED89330|nr:uncharacterized protein LOC124158445 [Ischnura elegans]